MIWNFWKCPILFFYLYHYGNNPSDGLRLLYKYQYYLTKQEKKTNSRWGSLIEEMNSLYGMNH